MARLASGLLVNALVRRVHAEGGNAAVLARGDSQSGTILVLTLDRGANARFFERVQGPEGVPVLTSVGVRAGQEMASITDYWQRRRSSDPDLWVVELDVAGAERLAAEVILPS